MRKLSFAYPRALGMFMSFVLAFTLVPLPAFAQTAGEDARDASGEEGAIRAAQTGIAGDSEPQDDVDKLTIAQEGQAGGSAQESAADDVVAVQDDSEHGSYEFPGTQAYMNYTFVNNHTELVINHLGVPHNSPGVDVVIPSEIDGFPVVGIDGTLEDWDFWFASYNYNSITIPKSVRYVEGVMFDAVRHVLFEKGSPVTTLPDRCFGSGYGYRAVTEEVALPDGLQAISEDMFYYNSEIKSIVLPDAVRYVRDEAFYGCESLSSVKLNDGLVSIGNRAFAQLYFDNSYVYTFYPHITSLDIPDSVTTIGNDAFSNVYTLASVTFGSGLTRIGDRAFKGASLTSVQIPNSVVYIGDEAFTYGRRPDLVPPVLASVQFGTSQADSQLQYLGTRAFAGQQMTSVTLPNGLQTLGYDEDTVTYNTDGSFANSGGAFCGCDKLESVVWPKTPGIASIGGFDGCTSLASDFLDDLPSWITAIDDHAFYNCAFTDLTIPVQIAEIGACAFSRSGSPNNQDKPLSAVFRINNKDVKIDYGNSSADWPWATGRGVAICYPDNVADESDIMEYYATVVEAEVGFGADAWWNYAYTTFWTFTEYEHRGDEPSLKNVSGTVPEGASVVLYVDDVAIDAAVTNGSFLMQEAEGAKVRAVVKLDGYQDYALSPSGAGAGAGEVAAPLSANWTFTVDLTDMTPLARHKVSGSVPQGATVQLLVDGHVLTPALTEGAFEGQYLDGTDIGAVISLDGYVDLRISPVQGQDSAPLNADWPFSVTADDMTPLSTTGTLKVLASGDGAWRCNVAVFDSAGKLVQQGATPTSMMYVAEGLPAGDYSVVAFAHNDFFSSIGSVDDFASLGVPAGSYTQTDASVRAQEVAEVSLNVPKMDLSALNDVVDSGGIIVNAERIVPEMTFYARVTYQMKDGHPADTVTVSVPEGIEVVSANTSSHAYGVSGYSSTSHTLTLSPEGDDQQGATVYVGLRVSVPGDYVITASAKSGAAKAAIGSADVSAFALDMQLPSATVPGREFPVIVYAAPDTTVTFTLGSTVSETTVKTNRSGVGIVELEIPDDELSAYSVCKVTAKAGGAHPAETSGSVSYTYIAPELAAEVHELKFHHGGTDVYVVKDGREPADRYYTCVAVGLVHSDLYEPTWPFSVSIDSAYPLNDTVTLELGMMDKSVRCETMQLASVQPVQGSEPLKRYTYTKDILIGTGRVEDNLTQSDIPIAFDVSYTFQESETPAPSQQAIDTIKESYSLDKVEWKDALTGSFSVAVSSENLTHVKAMTQTDYEGDDGNYGDVIFGAGYRQQNWSWDNDSALWTRVLDADERRTYQSFEQETDKLFDGLASVMGDEVPMNQCTSAEDYLQKNYGYRTGQVLSPAALKQLGYQVFYDGDIGSVEGAGTLSPDGTVKAPTWYAVKMADDETVSGASSEDYSSQESNDGKVTASYADSNGNMLSLGFWKKRIREFMQSASGSTELWELAQTINNLDALVGQIANSFEPSAARILFWNSNLQKIKAVASNMNYLDPGSGDIWIVDAFKSTFGYSQTAQEINAMKSISLESAEKMARIVKGVSYVTGAATVLLSAYSMYADENDLGNNWSEQSEVQGEIDYQRMMLQRYISLGGDFADSPCAQKVREEIAAAQAYQGILQSQASLTTMNLVETAALTTASVICLVAAAPAAPIVFAATLAWGAYNAFEGMALSAEASRLAGAFDEARAARERQCGANMFKKLRFHKNAILDPSGWVYAGVQDNRVSGVVATIYQVVEGTLVEWLASDYNQQNPQVTDSGGLFGWNVGEGTWRVKFVKDGYEDAWSDDMTVPPEWTDVAVNLVSKVAPQVSGVMASSKEIVVSFDQYMKTGAQLEVTVNGVAVTGTWGNAVLGANESNGQEFLATQLHIPLPANVKAGLTVQLALSGGSSYAGKALGATSRSVTVPAAPKPSVSKVSMHRLYNPYSGEHFYTASNSEKNGLVSLGWRYEGVGWNAPSSGADVYRLYNRWTGDHHFTTSMAEKNQCVAAGWTYEGVGWKSGGSVKVYREYNPYASAFYHNYTASLSEHNGLLPLGWRDEGVGWYGV